MNMKGLYTILLLTVSNVFMITAWYGHLKLQEMNLISRWSLAAVILFSWMLALPEYCFQVPANRMGFVANGGPFSLIQLKVIQEVLTLIVFTVFAVLAFPGEHFRWNHLVSFVLLVGAVYFAFLKPAAA
jgi:uncharacterized protein (DUF486 family)